MTDRNETLVLAIDPGRECGWTIGRGTDLEASGWTVAYDFMDFMLACLASGQVDRVVMERFDPRRWDDDAKFTAGVAWAIEWVSNRAGVIFAQVNASDKKKTIEEASERLDNRHARDAEAIRLWDLRYGRW